MERIRNKQRDGRGLLVGTSFNGNTLPPTNVVQVSDFILLHGNGVKQPKRIVEMVEQTRKIAGYHPMPIVFNEDDHYQFDQQMNNFIAAISAGASWGYFDFRRQGEGFEQGYQSVPVDWGINSLRKRAFFKMAKEITGGSNSN
jgi:hypothetical protein